jgi:hypothetical protein
VVGCSVDDSEPGDGFSVDPSSLGRPTQRFAASRSAWKSRLAVCSVDNLVTCSHLMSGPASLHTATAAVRTK